MQARLVVWFAVALFVYVGAFLWLLKDDAAERSTGEVLAGCAALGLAAVLWQLVFNRARREKLFGRLRWVVPAAVVVLGATGAAVFLTGTSARVIGSLGLASVCALYLGLGQLLAELRTKPSWCRQGPLIVAGCAGLFVIGFLVCVFVTAWGLLLSALAVLLAPVGLTLMSEDLLGRTPPWEAGRHTLAVCFVLAGALGLWVIADPPRGLLLAVVGIVGLLVLCIASSTQADVLLVVTVVVLVAAQGAVSVAGPAEPEPGDRTLVALGDSFMSGEGAPRFFEGTNDPAGNTCRRAPTAYAQRVVAEDGVPSEDRVPWLTGVVSVACSGAVARDLWDDSDPDEPPGEGRPQLDLLRESPPSDVRLVIVSIGGNDAGFSKIGSACLAPGNCAVLIRRWLDDLEKRVAPALDTAYEKVDLTVSELFGDDVRVAAVPYPMPLTDSACRRSLLRDDEHRVLVRFVRQLNRVVQIEAAQQGFEYVEPMAHALDDGLRICDGPLEDIGMNHVELVSPEGVVDQLIHPGNWIHNSLHPNEAGHAAMAHELAAWANEHPTASEVGPAEPDYTAPPLEQVLRNPPENVCQVGDGGHCGRDYPEWAVTKLGILAAAASPFMAILIAGFLMLSLALLRLTRPVVGGFGDWLSDRLFGSGRGGS